MGITKKAALLALAIAAACAISLVGCGGANPSASASATANASAAASASATATSATASASTSASASAAASEPSSAASARQANEQAQPYVGTWKADKITLGSKTNASDKEKELDIPIVVELKDDMTGTIAVGDSKQDFEWEVREWDALKVERAVVTMHETFELGNLVCDPEHLMLEFADSKDSMHFFANWTSSAQPGVKMSIDTTVKKAS